MDRLFRANGWHTKRFLLVNHFKQALSNGVQKILYIFPLFILFSCSVQKRKYQKGFYVSNNIHAKTKSASLNKEIKKDELALKTSILHLNSEKDAELTASINNKTSFLERIPINLFSGINDSLCDKITLKNGDEINVNVLELTPALIKYKKCNEPESPLYIVKKTDVFKIKYANGSQELMEEEVKKNPTPSNNPNILNSDYNGPRKTHPLAIWAFIFSILGLIPFLGIFTSIRAIVYATRALKAIRLNPNEYKGDFLATIALVLGIIGLVLLLLIIIAILAA